LAINSPGGEILGLDDVWQAVREGGKKKSVVAENRGLMASAAYWTASAASRIVATSPAALTGSIGVQMVTYDYSEADKEYGVRRVRITSKNAPKKNPDATTDDGRAVYQEQLDAIERVFISRISEGRGLSEEKIIKNFGQGALMIAEDPNKSMISAISVNMIDRVIGGESDRNSRKIDEKIEDANIRGAIESTDDTPEEGKNMATLAEIMKTDTAIKAEVEALTDAAYARGQSDTKSRNAKATAILASDKYPELIKAMAMQVLTGEKTAEALDGAVAYCDQMAERDKAAAAVKETVTAGPTPAAPPVVASPDGEVRSNDDHMAAVNRVRAAQGQKEIK
jgi:hypothetical protein